MCDDTCLGEGAHLSQYSSDGRPIMYSEATFDDTSVITSVAETLSIDDPADIPTQVSTSSN